MLVNFLDKLVHKSEPKDLGEFLTVVVKGSLFLITNTVSKNCIGWKHIKLLNRKIHKLTKHGNIVHDSFYFF